MKILIYFIPLIFISCQNCDKLPDHFESYEQAITAVQGTSFKVRDEMTNFESSWITSASFYSCDGFFGYMIIGMRENDYIFQGVPREVWNDFKKTDSKGEFYHKYIKGNYDF